MKREATKRKGKLANFGRMLGGMKQSKKNRRNSGKGGAAEEPGIQLGDLEHLRVLGTGTFGQVTLVRTPSLPPPPACRLPQPPIYLVASS